MMPATLMTDAELARLGSRDDAGFGALATARGALPLTAMTVDARVVGLFATVELAQTFENTLGEPIEATYIFPLPDRAAVTRFRMEVAGRVIEGAIDERAAARLAYNAAIVAGHRAAITEEERAGVFTLRVGNLMPREVATVRLTMTGPLPVEDGEVTFRFPLVVAPRYIPGRELGGAQAGLGTGADTDAVPDASRITPPVLLPGMPNPVRLAIKLVIDPAGVPVADVRASLHAAAAEEKGGAQVIELAPGERLDRDFIVRWAIGDAAIRSSLVWDADASGEGATFLLTLVPPRDAAPSRPRDVVFVLDRSGSMGGWKMVCARRAVARMVDTLGAKDRFAVLAFDNAIEEPDALAGALADATDRNRFRAVEFLAKVEARGGTEMAEPLGRAARLLTGGYDERDRVLVLVTDGQVGNEDQILRELGPRLKATRVFTLGVDQAVNAAFLRRLAAAGGGACELCESEDRLDVVMDKIHRRIATPVVTELALDGAGLAIDRATISPARLPALFAGAPIVISGRLARAPERGATITLSGRTPAGTPWKEPVVAAPEPGRGASIAQAWARARVRDLEDRFAMGDGGHDALEREIVATSKRFGVLSRFTAFLAVDKSEVVNPGGGQKELVQPVEAPAGWNMAPAVTRGGVFPPMSMAAPMAQAMPMAPMPPGAPMAMGGAGFAGPPPAPAKSMKTMMGSVPLGRGNTDGLAASPPPTPPVDDAPYRARTRSLADALDAAHAAGDGRELERAAVARGVGRALELAVARLAELVEDLTSIGGLDGLARALTAVRDRLRDAAGKGQLAAEAVAAAADLRRIAGAPAAAGTTQPDRPFWKFWK